MEKGLAIMDKALEGKEYVAGKFSVADAALFYVEFWAAARMKMTLPKNCAAHYERMKNRPAVKRTIEQEGLDARRSDFSSRLATLQLSAWRLDGVCAVDRPQAAPANRTACPRRCSTASSFSRRSPTPSGTRW